MCVLGIKRAEIDLPWITCNRISTDDTGDHVKISVGHHFREDPNIPEKETDGEIVSVQEVDPVHIPTSGGVNRSPQRSKTMGLKVRWRVESLCACSASSECFRQDGGPVSDYADSTVEF